MLPATAQASELVAQAVDIADTGMLATQVKKKKSVVVCFSCTGATWGMAKRIKKATGATLVRVKAKNAYTDDDIDWTALRRALV